MTKRMMPHTTVLMLIQMIKNFMAERLFKAMTAMIPHNTMAMKTDNKNTMKLIQLLGKHGSVGGW